MFNFKPQIRPPSLILLIITSQDGWIFPSQSWEVRNSMMIMMMMVITTIIIIEPSLPVHGTTFRRTAGCHGIRIGRLFAKRFLIRIMWKSLKVSSEYTLLTGNCSTTVSTRSHPHDVVCIFNYRHRGLQQLLACTSVLGAMELPVVVCYPELFSSAWVWAEERISAGIVIVAREDGDDDESW